MIDCGLPHPLALRRHSDEAHTIAASLNHPKHQRTLKCKDRNERLASKPHTRRVHSSSLHYENIMQVQRANFARKKSSSCEEKFLIHNPAAITKSRTAHRHFVLSAQPSFTIFAPCAPEDVGFPARLEHHGPPLCPHCVSVVACSDLPNLIGQTLGEEGCMRM